MTFKEIHEYCMAQEKLGQKPFFHVTLEFKNPPSTIEQFIIPKHYEWRDYQGPDQALVNIKCHLLAYNPKLGQPGLDWAKRSHYHFNLNDGDFTDNARTCSVRITRIEDIFLFETITDKGLKLLKGLEL